MEDKLFVDEYIAVNKFMHGSRFPITLLTVPFSNSHYSRFIELPYFRLPGLKKIRYNELIAFNNPVLNDPPIDKKKLLFGRIAALPGDTLLISKKKVIINSTEQSIPETCKFKFRVTINNKKFSDSFFTKYHVSDKYKIGNLNIYDFYLTRKKAKLMLADSASMYVREIMELEYKLSYDIFPANNFYVWNKDYYGPVIIPKKGTTIHLDEINLPLYRKIIETYEANNLEISNNEIMINGQPRTYYTFKQNYYFILSDNRDNGYDSRNWGFLPESHIVGKVWN
ncbi:MAG: hypothetical protein GXO79_15775 [Chlorobi bacterium]|nr:hypothetical protein [Chlorobiota bacterium]